ncbi:hypothetical protein [Bradyrhizobium diazoefficiens]|uniref:hypothetical protein n=1 Tax=Bradyrhizobium diazoefficiens TaxID=1355477 RepID=UPI003518D74A
MKPIVESYVPPAGIRHAVTAGETWISLAKRIGIDPWDLIEFNFPGIRLVKQRDFQQATRQVNWYLAEYVGCRAMSPDRQNFAFSSGTTGGKRWMARGIHLSAARYAASPTDCAHSTGCAHPSGSDPAGMWRKPTRLRARPRRQRTGFRAQRLWPDVAAMGDNRDYQWPGSRRKTVDERWTIL